MRKPRAVEFLYNPARYRYDPVVMKMSNAARGAYSMLFGACWEQHEPGVIDPATDMILSALALTSEAEWRKLRPEVEKAFDTTSRPGAWIQKGVVQTHREQTVKMARSAARGIKAANARWNPDALPDGDA